MTPPNAADDLYGLPLEQFTAARNALAKELAGRGQREEAQAVRGLVKPTRTAWAVNQLARRRPGDIERLIQAGERLHRAQSAALEGDATQLRATAQDEHDLVEELVAAASGLLPPASRAQAATQERLRRTLRAAAVDPETGARLRAGVLVADAEISGFGLDWFAEGDSAPGTDGDGDGDRTAAEERRQAQREATHRRKEAERAQQRARRLWDEAERAERRAEEARVDAERATEAAVEAQHQADQAIAEAEEAARQARS